MVHTILALALLACLAGPVSATALLPAEYEDHPALLVGCQNLLDNHRDTLRDLVYALHGDVEIYGLVNSRADARRLAVFLEDEGMEADRIRAIVSPTKGMWVRDYGPLFVSAGEELVIVDTRYRVHPDDDVPARLGEAWGVRTAEAELWSEGGHLVHNGRGLLLVSTMVARLNAGYDGVDTEVIRNRLRSSIPFEEAHWVEPMPGERTGHLDTFMVFVGPRRLVVAEVDPAENAELSEMLDATAERMAGLEQEGLPLEVLRVPTPTPADGVWFSYTNVILIGDQVLVPRYASVDDAANERALEFWRSVLPEREVSAVDATSIIRRNGALHCISMPLPAALGPAARDRAALPPSRSR